MLHQQRASQHVAKTGILVIFKEIEFIIFCSLQ